MERRRHWWNGQWGRLARRDIFLRVDGDQWWVETRTGGAEGASRMREFTDEDQALNAARDLLCGDEDWRELTIRPGR